MTGDSEEYLTTWPHEATVRHVKRKPFRYPPARAEALQLKEAALIEEPELVVNVRAAKDQLSSLLETAARGNEVIITSDGEPKAKLVPVRPRRRTFRVHWKLLEAQELPRAGALTAEELIREDRDSRP